MTLHECGCSTFGPGPHDADLRHPNPKACEHSEDGARLAVELADHVAMCCDCINLRASDDLHVRLAAARAAVADLDSIVDPSL